MSRIRGRRQESGVEANASTSWNIRHGWPRKVAPEMQGREGLQSGSGARELAERMAGHAAQVFCDHESEMKLREIVFWPAKMR
jgi:hypothetical protein